MKLVVSLYKDKTDQCYEARTPKQDMSMIRHGDTEIFKNVEHGHNKNIIFIHL